MRLIDANKFKDEVASSIEDNFHKHTKIAIKHFVKWIDEQPTVDATLVIHSHWVSVPGKRDRICAHCEHDEPYKNAPDDADIYEYCPHCGAQMDEKKTC